MKQQYEVDVSMNARPSPRPGFMSSRPDPAEVSTNVTVQVEAEDGQEAMREGIDKAWDMIEPMNDEEFGTRCDCPTERQPVLVKSFDDLAAAVKEQNRILGSIPGTMNKEALQLLADIMSGQTVGRGKSKTDEPETRTINGRQYVKKPAGHEPTAGDYVDAPQDGGQVWTLVTDPIAKDEEPDEQPATGTVHVHIDEDTLRRLVKEELDRRVAKVVAPLHSIRTQGTL